MIEDTIERMTRELRDEADIDFIDLPFIAENLREDLDLKTQDEIRRHTLEVVRRLMDRGVYPGDYDHAIHMAFWPGGPSEHLRRIEAEWIAMSKPLTLSDPICWLGLKPEFKAPK
jgi:hypothetical protein